MDCYGIPRSQMGNIKAGADWVTADGDVIPNDRLVRPADSPRSYAYLSDTRYLPQLHEQLQGVSTLYHESTYGEDHLLLGHYSSRYDDEQVLLREAKEVFENTYLTNEMDVIDV